MYTEHFLCEGHYVEFFSFIWLFNLYHSPLRSIQLLASFKDQ